MLRGLFTRDAFGLSHDRASDFSVCCWQKTRQVKAVWVVYRLLLMGIFIFTLLYVMVFWLTQKNLSDEDKPKFLVYLTYWTFYVETFLFFWGFVVAVVDYMVQRRGVVNEKLSLPAKVYWIVYTVVLPSAVSVTLLFWSLIYDKNDQPSPSNIILHVMNSVVVVIDFWLVAFPFRLLHIYMPYVYVSVYITFSVIYEMSGGTGPMGNKPIYKILDWKEYPGKTCMYLVIGSFVLFVVHVFFSLLYLLKIWMVEKLVRKEEDQI